MFLTVLEENSLMRTVIEIGGNTTHPVGKRLSNFANRPFMIDGVHCAGIEGFLQSLKCPDPTRQREICLLTGRGAKAAGAIFNNWKDDQKLYWQSSSFGRSTRSYILLVTRAYDELYAQDESFRTDLLLLGGAIIWHSIGNPNMHDTTLIETEMLWHLERLRFQTLRESLLKLLHPS